MVVCAESIQPMRYDSPSQFERRPYRHFAPLALALIVQGSTGCTLLGYGIGSAAIPSPESTPQSARTIAAGTEVEVFYLPTRGACTPFAAAAPPAAAPGRQATEFSVASGAYAGIEGEELVLTHLGSQQAAVTNQDGYDTRKKTSFEAVRVLVPLEHVSLIRTKPSSTPAVVGTLVGAVLDIAAIISVVGGVRNIQ